MSGKFHEGVREPTRIADSLFSQKSKERLRKVASGAHHTLALTKEGKIYAWGDPESGKLGRILMTRNKDKQALSIEKVGARDAVDIFAGNHHSFYVNKRGQVHAWGLNNHGQLGVGHKDNINLPTLVKEFADQKITMMAGGEHHSIAVTAEGKVYCWGRNDEGQCGRGDLYGQHKRQKAREEYERVMLVQAEEEEKKKLPQEEEKKGGEAEVVVEA